MGRPASLAVTAITAILELESDRLQKKNYVTVSDRLTDTVQYITVERSVRLLQSQTRQTEGFFFSKAHGKKIGKTARSLYAARHAAK